MQSQDQNAQSSVDIEKILQEIRQEIEEKGYTYDQLDFQDIPIPHQQKYQKYDHFDPARFAQELQQLNAFKEVQAHRPLATGIPAIGFLVVFVKKVIRKLTRFYIEPIVRDQNQWNTMAVGCLQSVEAFVEQSSQEQQNLQKLEELERENRVLKVQLERLAQQQNRDRERLEALAQQVARHSTQMQREEEPS